MRGLLSLLYQSAVMEISEQILKPEKQQADGAVAGTGASRPR